MVSVVTIHANPSLKNQIDCADALQQGFEQLGIDAEITASKRYNSQPGAINVVQGPWWIPDRFIGKPNVLWLDRTFYGCAVNNVSLGWLNPDGSRDFRNTDKTEGKGVLPELSPRKERQGTAIVFGDYGRDMSMECALARKFDRCYFKAHPQDSQQTSPFNTLRCPLNVVMELADVAIGHSSTVLVDAEIAGLHTISTDPRHVVHNSDRTAWLNRLSWAQWSLDEIRTGAAWEHLCTT